MRDLLDISLAPTVPASLRNIPVKYNIINRLWSIAFYKHLEDLYRAAFTSPVNHIAFELLQEFIYYAYTFYSGLYEAKSLESFRSNWLECLGDLARYRMAVTARAGSLTVPSSQPMSLAAISQAVADSASPAPSTRPDASALATGDGDGSMHSASEGHVARIDDSPVPSIGLAAARAMDVEPETERWRTIAREWFSAGVAITPGAGKLHHHLGLLSRDTESEELRAVYHFVKR